MVEWELMASSSVPSLASPPRAELLNIQVISDPAQADGIRTEWHALLHRSISRGNGLTLTPEWLLEWWREFGSLGGRQLRLTLFRKGEQLVGLAPLLRRRVWYPPVIPFRRLELLATGEPEADAICSDYLGVIAERGAEAEVATALAEGIARQALGSWDEVVLSMMAGDNPMTAQLAAAFAGSGGSLEQRTLGDAPYISLPASWDEYLKSLRSNDRRLIKTSLKSFEEWAGDSARLERVRDASGLERAKAVLVRLHQERWNKGGAFRSPRFQRFHDAIMRWQLASGDLELLTLWAHGEAISALYNLVWEGKVYFYQSGRNLDVSTRIRPGVVILSLAIRSAIEAGRREFDFLYGASRYKQQLALASRPLVEIRMARSSLRERLRCLAEYGRAPAREVKQLLHGAGHWLKGARDKSPDRHRRRPEVGSFHSFGPGYIDIACHICAVLET
jgi:CelD/BcsL family acetyltransferase involved in cellulose biosynthesis